MKKEINLKFVECKSHLLEQIMYKNPGFIEARVLKAQNPDTLRITIDNKNNFYVANGYGATHTHIMRRFNTESGADLILKRNGELWLVNEDELVKPSEFSEEFAMFVNDFLAEE